MNSQVNDENKAKMNDESFKNAEIGALNLFEANQRLLEKGQYWGGVVYDTAQALDALTYGNWDIAQDIYMTGDGQTQEAISQLQQAMRDEETMYFGHLRVDAGWGSGTHSVAFGGEIDDPDYYQSAETVPWGIYGSDPLRGDYRWYNWDDISSVGLISATRRP